jgi:hypothetical protein
MSGAGKSLGLGLQQGSRGAGAPMVAKRAGLERQFTGMAEDLRSLPDCVIDGEACAHVRTGCPTSGASGAVASTPASSRSTF